MTTHLLPKPAVDVTVGKLRSRDREVWNELVASQHRRLFNLHLRLCGDREAAADLTQETFKTAFECSHKFEGRCQPVTWLYGIGLNVNRNWRRRQGRVEKPAPPDGQLSDPEPTPEQLAVLREQSHRVYEAVAALPEAYRQVVALRYFAGIPAVEIAQVEGLKPETVRWRLHQALRLLWAALQPDLGKEYSDVTAAQ